MALTIRELIQQATDNLTASERKIAGAILADYPFTALQTIQDLAAKTGVSAPSITRFVAKLGCGGFQDFQRQLIAELKEGKRSPLDLKSSQVPVGHSQFLGDYAARLSLVIADMAETVSQEQFDAVATLLSDPTRQVFLLGGRVSDSLASYLSIHLRQIRARIQHIPANPQIWPDVMLQMRKKDVVVLFDFRRYQPDLAELAHRIATHAQATVILITDRWLSPIARDSSHVIALPIDSGTAWDTVVAAIAFLEALIVKVSEADWEATQKRLRQWDGLRLDRPAEDDI